MVGCIYGSAGITSKPAIKMYELMDSSVTENEWLDVRYNILAMKGWCS